MGDIERYNAVARLYHAFMTGLVLSLVSQKGTEAASRLIYRLFRHQQTKRFLPGLQKLGLEGLPDAVACAQYHYLSNFLGTVHVEYMYEADHKAWIRYPPPRWMWEGTAICGIPSVVSAAMLHGWHGQNGVSLRNKKLGFVCTGQTVEGYPGLEGYFLEYNREITPDERVRFVTDERAPTFKPELAPRLASTSWPIERIHKAERNYAMEFLRSTFQEMSNVFEPPEAHRLLSHTARLVGMQYYRETARILEIPSGSLRAFASYMTAMARAQGDTIEETVLSSAIILRQSSWNLMRDVPVRNFYFDAWNSLWEGAVAAHDRDIVLRVSKRIDRGDPCFEWHLSRHPG